MTGIESILAKIKVDAGNVRLYQELARAYLDAGEEERAREVVLRRRNMPTADSAVHRVWAELCEELGAARLAQESYERALKFNPEDSETLFHLARFFHEVGQYEKSLHHLKRVVKRHPEHQAARELLAETYRSLGQIGQAEALVPKPAAPEGIKTASPPRYFPPIISEQHTARFQQLFAGREIGYAVQQIDPATGELSYNYHDAPLSPQLIASHLLGDITLAAYPMRLDNAAHYAAVSIRIPTRLLEANLKNVGYLALMEEKMRQHTLLLGRLASEFGLAAYPEDSGDHQYRLWFFFSEFTHFLKIKRFVMAFLEKAPEPSGNLLVEPILATRPIGLGWVEHPVVLPLGIQRTTLRRSFFLDDEGKPHAEQLKFMRKIREISPKTATRAMRGLTTSTTEYGPTPGALPATVKKLCRRCAVLRELSQKP